MEYDGKVSTNTKRINGFAQVLVEKVPDIMMRFVWGAPNIAVDTHVFRLLWRLG